MDKNTHKKWKKNLKKKFEKTKIKYKIYSKKIMHSLRLTWSKTQMLRILFTPRKFEGIFSKSRSGNSV